MLDKILAPLDGSELAEAVLPHLVALTRVNGTTITLLHVLEAAGRTTEHSSPDVDPVVWHLRKTEAQNYLQEVAARLAHFDLATNTDLLEGRAAERIVKYAQKEDFDLVALSSHGQGNLSGWNLSSVAHKVVQRIRKSTLLVPAHRSVLHRGADSTLRAAQYRRILVPLDGSPRAECVLPFAEALARHHEAELILVHVVTAPEMIQRVPLSDEDHALRTQIVERNRTEAERYFQQLQARLSPTPVTHVLSNENVAHVLLRFTRDEAIDLVILAAHGQTGHNGYTYGRLATSLINYGDTPLYIHQDLQAHEFAPLYAEEALHEQQPYHEQRINAYEYAVN